MSSYGISKSSPSADWAFSVGDAISIGALVREIFSLLDAEGILWAVLRGGAGLPEETRYDIDLLVRSTDLQQAASALVRAAELQGWQSLKIVDKYQYCCYLLVSSGPQPRFLPIDLAAGCYYRTYPYADAEYALRRRRKTASGVWVVPPGFCAVETLIKELMRKDSFKANSREETHAGALADPRSFVDGASLYLGEPLVQRMLDAAQSGAWEQMEMLAPEIRRNVRSHRVRMLPGLVEFVWKNFHHHFKPPMSLFLVLLGPDGAGKSTTGDLVAEKLYHSPFKTCQRFEHNFNVLPELKHFKATIARLLGRKVHVSTPVQAGVKGSGMNHEHGAIRASLYVAYYSFDFVVGHLKVRKLRGQGGLIVFARYFHDYYYQKGYARVPRWFLRFVERAVPKPDLILYLHRRAEDIYSDKPELDLTEIKRQQAVIAELLKGRENTSIVDASGGVDATVQRVAQIVISSWLTEAQITIQT